jgi:hypothetical protein
LIKEPDDLIKAAAAWSLGQIGGHSADHARAMAEADVPSHLLAVYILLTERCINSKNPAKI